MTRVSYDIDPDFTAGDREAAGMIDKLAAFTAQLRQQGGGAARASGADADAGDAPSASAIAGLTGLAMMANAVLQGLAAELLLLSGARPQPSGVGLAPASGVGSGGSGIATELAQVSRELAQINEELGGSGVTGATASIGGFGTTSPGGGTSPAGSDPPVQASRRAGGLPATEGLSQAQKYALYTPMLDQKGQADLAEGKRVVLALRQNSAPSANGGNGVYNDRVVVLWQDGQGQHAEELRANTKPSAQYGAGGARADHGRADLGQLSPGTYTFDQAGSFLGNASWKSEEVEPVDRFEPGQYDATRPTKHDATGAGNSLLIHQGGADNTWSAGCQTLPPEDFERFKSLLAGQSSFHYELADASGPAAPAGGGVTAAAGGGIGGGIGGNIAGLTPEGLKFIYDHEHEDGKLIDHPSAASGVTIGAGYDLSGKSAQTIRSDLIRAGASTAAADTLAQAAGLTGGQADAFVAAHKHLLDGIDKGFELRLVQPELEEDARAVDQAAAAGGRTLTPHERDALISYVFNVGVGQFQKGAAGQALRRGDLAGTEEGLRHGITRSGSVVLAGLVQRRQEEAKLFTA